MARLTRDRTGMELDTGVSAHNNVHSLRSGIAPFVFGLCVCGCPSVRICHFS
jgi:hypothetical protein